MPGQFSHCALLTQESLYIVWVQSSARHLDRNSALERTLAAPEDGAETAPSNLFDVIKPGCGEFGRDCRRQIGPGSPRIELDHWRPRLCCRNLATAQPPLNWFPRA
jgi:hypothetical protein